MVKYNCENCIHKSVCSYKGDSIKEAKKFTYTSKLSNLECDLCCKHYVSTDSSKGDYDDEY